MTGDLAGYDRFVAQAGIDNAQRASRAEDVFRVLRDGKAQIPRGNARLEVGDDVVLFARREERDLVQLLFPGPEPEEQQRA
jgi:NhaP-type Na+/H+ and K+/H+ antiporter